MSLKKTPTFKIGRNDPCFCGSGERFKRCCGATGQDRKPPHGVVVIEQYLSQEECRRLVELVNSRPSERLQVIDPDKTTAEALLRRYDDTRVTRRVDMTDHQEELNTLLRKVVTTRIEPDLGINIDWFEEPQILKYEPGGFYATHADSENYDPEENCWTRVADRDVSLLLYLSDDFEGGDIQFNTFHYQLKPRAGMLVYFPSDHRYVHTAMPVTSGMRYAIVSWMSQRGVEKLRPPPDNAIVMTPEG